MKNLEAKAWFALAVLTVAMALLLFVPAGTVHYWQAWVYLGIFAAVSTLMTLDLIRKDPALLARRMRGAPTAEKEPAQKLIMLGISIGFVALLVVPALDHRFGRSTVPVGGVVVGDAIRTGSPSNVRERDPVSSEHAARPGLVLGACPARRDDAIAGLAASRRGALPRQESRRIY